VDEEEDRAGDEQIRQESAPKLEGRWSSESQRLDLPPDALGAGAGVQATERGDRWLGRGARRSAAGPGSTTVGLGSTTTALQTLVAQRCCVGRTRWRRLVCGLGWKERK
jgi:hypothetical protein